MLRTVLWILLLSAVMVVPCRAKTLVVAGRISSEMTVTQQVTFGVNQRLSELVYRFPVPADIRVPSISQRLADHNITFQPEPESVTDDTDEYGNLYKVVTWKNLGGDARAKVVFTLALDAVLDPLVASASFPLTGVSNAERLYLKPTAQVQSSDRQIVGKAAELTAGARSESAAVDAILNYVTDHIRYESPPKSYDALYGFSTGTGNCQNFAHLACALLRASGIPARVAVGLTLKDKWKIPLDDKGASLVQGMGEGLHAWIEVWFPGLGWLPCDPQQSKQFTSTRHIKYAHGPECSGIGTSWKASPVLPRYSTVLSSTFSRDSVKLSLKGAGAEPRGYMASFEMIASAPQVVSPPSVTPLPLPSVVTPALLTPPTADPEVDRNRAARESAEQKLAEQRLAEQRLAEKLARQKTVAKPPEKVVRPPITEPDKDGMVVFGNMRFPTTLSLYTESGDRGEASLEQETAEYVTSSSIYAQAFMLDQPLRLDTVSLATKKFGGDGTVYLDIVADDNGKPSLVNGVRSQPVYLENVRRLPGYSWLDFKIPSDTEPFLPGKYWVVLRRSGEAILNWYYTPGKPYGGPDDTRSTARGWQWEDILTYDFVFKVAGRQSRQ